MVPGLDRPVPQLLTPLQQTLCRVGFVVCLTSFVVGSVGLGTLLDEKGNFGVSHSQFAKVFRRVVAFNPITACFLVNGGLLGMLLCFVKLRDHKQLMQKGGAEKSSGDSAEVQKDTKKTK